MRGRLPKFEKPKVDVIENLSASVIIDQSRLGGNAHSTVGTISDMYASLRLLYSRIGDPYVGTASYFSFNDPNGMCPECFGIGKVIDSLVTSLTRMIDVGLPYLFFNRESSSLSGGERQRLFIVLAFQTHNLFFWMS